MSPFAGIGPSFRHRAAGRCGNVFFILFFENFEEVGNEGFFQEITFEPAVNEEVYNSVRPKQGQVLGDVRLANIEGIFEIAHTLNALREFFEDFDSDRMGDDFEQIDAFFDWDHAVVVSFQKWP
jgi:hypothetical protein